VVPPVPIHRSVGRSTSFEIAGEQRGTISNRRAGSEYATRQPSGDTRIGPAKLPLTRCTQAAFPSAYCAQAGCPSG
jgi:hypothetical protein